MTTIPARDTSSDSTNNGATDDTHGSSEDPHVIEFERMLDDKGRITIPPRIRRALGTEFVTARGTDGFVLVVPLAVWPEIEERLNEELASDDRYLQFAIHNRTRAVLDRQGRLKLPKHLLEWAQLESGDAAAIVANGQKFEVWNKRALQVHAKTTARAIGHVKTVS
jgi:MraZ protein